jgi:hypothetical protein
VSLSHRVRCLRQQQLSSLLAVVFALESCLVQLCVCSLSHAHMHPRTWRRRRSCNSRRSMYSPLGQSLPNEAGVEQMQLDLEAMVDDTSWDDDSPGAL